MASSAPSGPRTQPQNTRAQHGDGDRDSLPFRRRNLGWINGLDDEVQHAIDDDHEEQRARSALGVNRAMRAG